MEIACPQCGETESLRGTRSDDSIQLACGSCGYAWERNLAPSCKRCGGDDMQAVPLAILEKGRGTQLSVVGTRTIHLCSACDAETLRRYHDNRPNPLMPDDIPTAGL
jgi:predicted RNA-binding Zn-ribbon protein involved in translation (DUF1610 family)